MIILMQKPVKVFLLVPLPQDHMALGSMTKIVDLSEAEIHE